jgi:hypothetical protein
MIVNNQVCGVCHSEAGVDACLCDGVILLLCVQCSRNHFTDRNKDHNSIDLDLALRMQADYSLVESYLDELPNIFELLKPLRELSNKAERVKKRYKVYKQRLVTYIEEIFDKSIEEIEEITQDYSEKIKTLNIYKTSLCEEGECLIKKYKSSGIQAIVNITIESSDIPLDEILEYLTNAISGQVPKTSSLPKKGQLYDNLRSEIEEKVQKFNSLNEAYKNQIFKNGECMIHISNLQTQVEELKSAVIMRDNQISSMTSQLEHQLNNSCKEIDRLKLELQNKDNYVREKDDEINYLVDIQKSLYSQIDKLLEACTESETKVKELSQNIQILKQDTHQETTISSTSRRYIYCPSSCSKYLMQYDIQSEKVKIIDIPSLSINFSNTSSCELPSGDVFLAGFSDPVSSEAFIYEVATQEIINLPPLSYPRYFLALLYHKNYVYAFGGINSNRAERYSLETSSWEILPKMRYKRAYLSCVVIDDHIYLFYGGYNNIEVFDTNLLQFNNFYLDNSDYYSSIFGVAYRLDDRVYLLTDNLIQIYDTTLNKHTKYSNTYKYIHFSIHSIIPYENSIYYYNFNTFILERIDTTLPRLEPSAYPHNLNKYIYNTRVNTREIHRIDIEYSTLEVFDLSTYLDRNFSNTSVCVLDSGEVVIAGFGEPVVSKCYLFSPFSNSCTRLPNLNTPRCWTTLIYHNNCVYAFGGRISMKKMIKKAERIDMLSKSSWDVLPDMIRQRSTPSCIGVYNKIYIIGGNRSSIEIYNIDTNTYKLSKVSLNTDFVVSVMIDDQIHIIGEKNYKILTKNLKILSELQDEYEGNYSTYTMGNIKYYGGKIYFYNEGSEIFERVDPINFEREVLLITHRII